MPCRSAARSSITLLLAIALTSPAQGEADAFEAPSGAFTVDFPTKPIAGKRNKRTFVGTIREVWFESQSEAGHFLVGYTHLPGILVFFGGHRHVLKRAKEIFLDKEGAQQVSYETIDIDGRSAKQLVFRKTSGEMGKAYFIFEERRVYLVVGTSPKGLEPVDAFLTSFRLSTKPADQPPTDL